MKNVNITLQNSEGAHLQYWTVPATLLDETLIEIVRGDLKEYIEHELEKQDGFDVMTFRFCLGFEFR